MHIQRRPPFRLSAARCIALAICIAPVHDVARAQSPSTTGYSVFAGGGFTRLEVGDVNDRLAAVGVPAFGSTSPAVAAAAYWRLPGQVLLGAEWHFNSIGRFEQDGRVLGLGGGYATVGAAYVADVAPRLRIYPRLGFGAAGMGLWIEQRPYPMETEPVPFDSALTNTNGTSATSTTLSQGSVVADIGLGAEWLFNARYGAVLAVRTGYIADLDDRGWTQRGRRLSDAPDATMAGPYVRLLVGLRREKARGQD